MDYRDIERLALSQVLTEVGDGEGPLEVTHWKRDWTNAGRKEIQRTHDFPEMKRLYPDEAEIGLELVALAGVRRVALPSGFKDFVSDHGDLWRLEEGVHVPLSLWVYEDLVDQFNLEDLGPPEAFHVTHDAGGAQKWLELYPAPALDTPLRLHGYFYVADIPMGDPDPAIGYEDFLSRLDPILVKERIAEQAYIALEMWDSAARMAQSAAGRAGGLVADAIARELRPGGTFVPTFRAGEGRRRSRSVQGYPFWRR